MCNLLQNVELKLLLVGTTPKVKKPLDKRGRKMYTNKADSRGVVRKRTELKANTWTVASRAEKRF